MPPDDQPESPEGEFDASDPRQVNQRKRRAKTRQADEDEVIRGLLGSFKGRAWYWKQLSACHIFEASWRQDGTDAMIFREGERNIGLRLLAQLMRASPESYVLMTQENTSNG